MLYHRCLHLSRSRYRWLVTEEDPRLPMDLGSLRTCLASRAPEEALEAGTALLESFDVVLTSLVGPRLTETLLRSLWLPQSSGPAAQDLSS